MPTIVSPTSSTTWKGSANIIWNKRVFWCSYLWNYFYSPTYSQTQEFTSPFISSPPIHSMAPDRTHSSLHLYNFRSTASSVLLTSPPSYHSPMLPTSTTPLFSYRSLFLQAGNSYIHFYVSVHVIPPPFMLPSYLSSSLSNQILPPIKLPPISSYLQCCDKTKNGTGSRKGLLFPAPGQPLRAIPSPS